MTGFSGVGQIVFDPLQTREPFHLPSAPPPGHGVLQERPPQGPEVGPRHRVALGLGPLGEAQAQVGFGDMAALRRQVIQQRPQAGAERPEGGQGQHGMQQPQQEDAQSPHIPPPAGRLDTRAIKTRSWEMVGIKSLSETGS
jgi:hypothetical protein